MSPGICPTHRRRGCTCGGVTARYDVAERTYEDCQCVHAFYDHVIDMKAPRPLLRCIAYGCDCQLFAPVVAS